MIFKVGRIAHSRLNLNQFNSTFSCHQTHRDFSSIHTNSKHISIGYFINLSSTSAIYFYFLILYMYSIETCLIDWKMVHIFKY